ncbi:TolC family protein [Flavobacterium sp. EDS]|uniref:TolC family protein n=1 Tax=Flavobacterium sp. EDS TaxID=2897328 RepID=UPI001E4DB406|nr:TolC family protein [Flavobacterium sp. EDS]MCD0473218.1 TolC family protein [Flavobacterium sp. EDS]
MKMQFFALVFIGLASGNLLAQTVTLPNALERSVQNFEKIKAKEAMVLASRENVIYQKSQYLPDFTLIAQQSYGTINAQNGPMYGFGGLGVASTSMPLQEQNWNAAFGSLYLANINWNLFTFGKIKNQVAIAKADETVAQKDLDQLKFQHQVKVGAAYLNLLAAQRVKFVQDKNLERAAVVATTTESRSNSGLIPEVDFSLAKAEVANAKSAVIKANDLELDYSKALAVMMGEEYRKYELDSLFTNKTPMLLLESSLETSKHPILEWQNSAVQKSVQQEKLQSTLGLPTISSFGVIQGRGSGFDWNYVQDNSAFSKSYSDGVGIDRSNYLVGIGISWNLMNIYRQSSKKKEQKFITQSLQKEYEYMNQELVAQQKLADDKLKNAFENFEETKTQVKAATKAYQQHTALYNNGLTTIVDLTQSFYALNRAEIDYEIAQNNIWQALWIKAAAKGDLSILLNAIY